MDDMDDNGLTSLMWAARAGRLSTAKYLVSQGANLALRDDATGFSALHFAAYYCRYVNNNAPATNTGLSAFTLAADGSCCSQPPHLYTLSSTIRSMFVFSSVTWPRSEPALLGCDLFSPFTLPWHCSPKSVALANIPQVRVLECSYAWFKDCFKFASILLASTTLGLPRFVGIVTTSGF